MSDFVTTAAAFRSHLEDNFTALPVYWPNDDRDPIASGGAKGWVYAELYVVDERPVSLGYDGTRRHRDTCIFDVFVYMPRGSRTGLAEQHAQTIRNLFKSNSIPGAPITSRRIGLGETVEGPQGRWYAVPIRIEFFTDRTE